MKSKKKILNPSSGRNPKYLDEYETYTHKKCSKCNKIKLVTDFSKSTQKNRIGWAYRSYCKDCGNRQTREYAICNRPKRNKRLRDYRKNNPEKMKVYDKRGRLKHKYKISLDDYNKMFQEQSGLCYLCEKSKKLIVDHCHITGKVRKLLCHGCNTVLGKIENANIEKFEKYIQEHADILLKVANEN